MPTISVISLRKLALVLVGGFCGTLARYYLAAPLLALAALALPGAHGGFPFDIFAINLTGAFALGLLYGLAERGARVSPEVRLALGTGFLGAYTTFSTFTVGGDKLLMGGAWLAGMVYFVGSIALGVLAAHLGHLAAGAMVGRRRLSRSVRVRARRVWRKALAPIGHGMGVQPWRLAHRDAPRAGHAAHAGHATSASHTGTHPVRRSGAGEGIPAASTLNDGEHGEQSGYADRQEDDVR